MAALELWNDRLAHPDVVWGDYAVNLWGKPLHLLVSRMFAMRHGRLRTQNRG